MKKTLIFINFLFFFSLFAQNKINFKIQGKVNGLNNSFIYFSYDGVGKERKWDSVKIKNNKFFFEGFIGESKNGFLTTLKKNRVSELSDPKITDRLFIDPNSTIEINIDGQNFHQSKISGSKSQTQFNDYEKLINKNNYKEITKKYILENYNSYFGLYLLKYNCSEIPYPNLSKIAESLSVENQKSEYGIYLLKYLEKLKQSVPGQKAIAFSEKDNNGKNVDLSDFKDKYILIDFWASWCKPCREKNPELIDLYNTYRNDGFTIIGIASDEETTKQWKQAIKKDKIDIWTHINNDTIGDLYSIPYLPTQILIDKNGIIIHRYDDINESFVNLKSDLKSIFKK